MATTASEKKTSRSTLGPTASAVLVSSSCTRAVDHTRSGGHDPRVAGARPAGLDVTGEPAQVRGVVVAGDRHVVPEVAVPQLHPVRGTGTGQQPERGRMPRP